MAVAAALLLACLATVGGMFVPHASVSAKADTTTLQPVAADQAPQDWAHYGNTAGGTRFAALDQITRSKVKDLQFAWSYQTGDVPVSADGGGAEDQLTPLQIGNNVFVCTPHNNVIALDATTGKELWKTEINAKQKKHRADRHHEPRGRPAAPAAARPLRPVRATGQCARCRYAQGDCQDAHGV